MKRSIIISILIVISIMTFTFLNNAHKANAKEFTLWLAYWDIEDYHEEVKAVEDNVHAISHFAAYFDDTHHLFIPTTTLKTFKETNPSYLNYLSVVNDIAYEDKTSSLKDTDLLYELFKHNSRHIDELIALTKTSGFQGIEIDYEGMKDDLELWELYVAFIKELYAKTQDQNLLLRVVLEPSVPSDTLDFPQGPEYVLMAYNLHGHGSDPGPKANEVFLKQMAKKQNELPGDLNMALALGGFDFSFDDSISSITQKEAHALIEKYEVEPKRDKESQSLYFTYFDTNNIEHEVWFADAKTINFWISVLEEKGIYKYSLWKIGGNLKIESILQ